MRERPVIAAMLDTGDSFLHLEKQEIKEETAIELGYRDTRDVQSYSNYINEALQVGTEEHLPNYHTVAEKLLEEPDLLYEQGLLRPETENQVKKHRELLKETAERPLTSSELGSITLTAMKDTQKFPQRAIDKEELLDRLYVGLYSTEEISASLPRDEPIA